VSDWPTIPDVPDEEKEQCAALLFAETHDPPQPPEYCEELAEEGSQYCENHYGWGVM
jgi:hypothetical protein